MKQDSDNRIQQQKFRPKKALVGAVCITNGNTEAIIALISNRKVMTSHLELISKTTQAERHVVVQGCVLSLVFLTGFTIKN